MVMRVSQSDPSLPASELVESTAVPASLHRVEQLGPESISLNAAEAAVLLGHRNHISIVRIRLAGLDRLPPLSLQEAKKGAK
jgi:hypothetical protein